jgi:putative redox protein
MAGGITRVELNRVGSLRFQCVNSEGKSAVIDGPSLMGGEDDGVRPMEMILMGLAGCSSFDVLNILKKQRIEVQDLKIEVEGKRAETIPSVFTDILVRFIVKGDIPQTKLDKAIKLSMEKYCSVSHMLSASVSIHHESVIIQ